MPETHSAARARPIRTVLEQRIRERQQTFEEFAEYAEQFARNHGEPGTLSVRHLQRLVAGTRPDGRPLGPVRPATARLLEGIFGESTDLLLAPPSNLDMSDTEHRRVAHALRVAVAVVVKQSEVLVVCRRDGKGLSWQFPAGMIKPGMSAEVVAARETLAETGVHCVAVHRLGSRLHPMTNVFCDYTLCDYIAGDAANLDAAENSAVAWVDTRSLTCLIPGERLYPPVRKSLHIAEL